jgi:hypothetical protein
MARSKADASEWSVSSFGGRRRRQDQTCPRTGCPARRVCQRADLSREGLRSPYPKGLLHPLVGVLAVAASAVLTGATSLLAISEWAADASQSVLTRLGARRDPFTGRLKAPCEATLRRVLATVDGDELDQAVSRWLTARSPQTDGCLRTAVAVDGKALRGAAPRQRPQDPPPGGRRSRHQHRPRPGRRRREDKRDPLFPAATEGEVPRATLVASPPSLTSPRPRRRS